MTVTIIVLAFGSLRDMSELLKSMDSQLQGGINTGSVVSFIVLYLYPYSHQ